MHMMLAPSKELLAQQQRESAGDRASPDEQGEAPEAEQAEAPEADEPKSRARRRRRGRRPRRGSRRRGRRLATAPHRGSPRDPGLRRPRLRGGPRRRRRRPALGLAQHGPARPRRSSASSPSTSAPSTSLALSSCTAALHLACIVAGVGPGDEVIVPVDDLRRHGERRSLLRRHAGLRRHRRRAGDLNMDVEPSSR